MNIESMVFSKAHVHKIKRETIVLLTKLFLVKRFFSKKNLNYIILREAIGKFILKVKLCFRLT